VTTARISGILAVDLEAPERPVNAKPTFIAIKKFAITSTRARQSPSSVSASKKSWISRSRWSFENPACGATARVVLVNAAPTTGRSDEAGIVNSTSAQSAVNMTGYKQSMTGA
jgi:hypothetical protein